MNDQNGPGESFPDEEARRIWWRSRRGLREVDLLLLPFVEDVLPGLGAEDRDVYRRLIDCEDTDLMALLMRRETPDAPELAAMVDRILAHRRVVT
jgi:antitoxin CptB